MDRPVVIVHFQPLELYPPVMNFIRYLEKYYEDSPVEIITTSPASTPTYLFKSVKNSLHIRRFGKICKQQFFVWRVANYFIFYIITFCRLLILRPSKIMYYETLSAWPVYLYRKYINSNVSVFIHYHEYVSKTEYATGMKLARVFHDREQFLYRVAKWVSHTNADRMKLFLDDEALKPDHRFNIMPNYPPQSWVRKPLNVITNPFKIVYVGAVSMETMFTAQFAEWVMQQKGKVSWHIYSNNITSDATFFLENLQTDYIHLKKGVDYYSLPAILKQYQVGIILYKGHIPNYVYNAPNKLFEYLACGLDVWVPQEMNGCIPYYTDNTYPKVIPVNFKQLNSFSVQKVFNKEGCMYQPSRWHYETVYPVIANELFMQN